MLLAALQNKRELQNWLKFQEKYEKEIIIC